MITPGITDKTGNPHFTIENITRRHWFFDVFLPSSLTARMFAKDICAAKMPCQTFEWPGSEIWEIVRDADERFQEVRRFKKL